MSAEAALLDLGCHLVLVTREKRPLSGRSWKQLRPSARDAERHRERGGVLAVVPWSIRATALDLDVGNAEQLVLRFGPWARLPSRKLGHEHLYFDDVSPRGNSKWSLDGASGDVRSARGYLILWNDGPELLLAALRQRVANACPFPVELLEPPAPPPAAIVQAGADQDRSQLGEPPLEHVLEGARQKALFSVLSRWAFAYRQQNKVGSDWPARVLTEALDQNARFPDPLPPAEVASTARSVASFRGVGMFDHSPKTQARRGVASAKVRRFLVYERDLEMAALVGAGHSLRAVARAFGVCHRTVAGAQDRLSRPRRAPREHP